MSVCGPRERNPYRKGPSRTGSWGAGPSTHGCHSSESLTGEGLRGSQDFDSGQRVSHCLAVSLSNAFSLNHTPMMIATPHLLLLLTSRSYVLGRKANEKERQAALQVADGFISRMRYSPNTQVRTNSCPHLLLLVPSCGSLPQPEQDLDTSGVGSRLACLRPVRWKGLSVLQPFKKTKQKTKPKTYFQRESWEVEG